MIRAAIRERRPRLRRFRRTADQPVDHPDQGVHVLALLRHFHLSSLLRFRKPLLRIRKPLLRFRMPLLRIHKPLLRIRKPLLRSGKGVDLRGGLPRQPVVRLDLHLGDGSETSNIRLELSQPLVVSCLLR